MITLSAFMGACGGTTSVPNNAPANNANVPKTNAANAVAVTTPTPSQVTNDAPNLTAVYKSFCEAMLKKDEAAIRKTYSADTLKNFAEQMKDNNVKSLLKFFEGDMPTGTCSVKDEVITGDRAVGKIVNGSIPNGFTVVFVKENGEWKMTNQSPTFDAAKTNSANTTTK